MLGSGVILNRSTPVYDLVRGEVYRATDDDPAGDSRRRGGGGRLARIQSGAGKDWGISLYTPVIVKYRDSKTDTKIQLEDLLR